MSHTEIHRIENGDRKILPLKTLKLYVSFEYSNEEALKQVDI